MTTNQGDTMLAYHNEPGLKEMFMDKSEFLPKPYTVHQLIEAIARLLQSN